MRVVQLCTCPIDAHADNYTRTHPLVVLKVRTGACHTGQWAGACGWWKQEQHVRVVLGRDVAAPCSPWQPTLHMLQRAVRVRSDQGRQAAERLHGVVRYDVCVRSVARIVRG